MFRNVSIVIMAREEQNFKFASGIWEEKSKRRQQRAETVPSETDAGFTCSDCNRQEWDFSVTASTVTQQQTKPWRILHRLLRQTDAKNNQSCFEDHQLDIKASSQGQIMQQQWKRHCKRARKLNKVINLDTFGTALSKGFKAGGKLMMVDSCGASIFPVLWYIFSFHWETVAGKTVPRDTDGCCYILETLCLGGSLLNSNESKVWTVNIPLRN